MVLTMLKDLGVPEKNYALNFSIARGLDYYTGTVVETRLTAAPELGSIMSGGRYDDLAGSLGKKKLPGVGISIGISRLASWLLAKPGYALGATPARVLVACQDDSLLAHYAELAQRLRAQGIAVEQSLGGMALGTQLKNADKRGIAHAVIVGDKEHADGTALVKNLATGEQRVVKVRDIADAVK